MIATSDQLGSIGSIASDALHVQGSEEKNKGERKMTERIEFDIKDYYAELDYERVRSLEKENSSLKTENTKFLNLANYMHKKALMEKFID